MLVPRPTGSHVVGAAPKRRAPDALSLALRAGISPQQRQLDLQEIQSWFQSGSMQGGLWLPDWAYLSQDSAGTAVTAAGQVVGIWRDATWGGQLGSECWNSSDPSIGQYGGSSGAYDASARVITNSSGADSGFPRFRFDLGLVTGIIYGVSGRLSGNISHISSIRIGTSGSTSVVYNNTTGVFFAEVAATSNILEIGINGTLAPTSIKIESISVRRVLGNHATQTTTANKPLSAITPQTQLPWLTADATDVVPVVFPSALGSACTIARATPTGVKFADSQTVNATWNDLIRPSQYNSAVCVLNRAPTAYERAVIERILERYVPVLGANLVINGRFDSGYSNWSKANAWSWSGGVMAIAAGGAADSLVQSGVVSQNRAFMMSANLAVTSGSIRFLSSGAGYTGPSFSANGLNSCVVVPTSTGTNLGIAPVSEYTGTLDNVETREVL